MMDRPHGNANTYKAGCRCDECTAGNTKLTREYVARNRERVAAQRKIWYEANRESEYEKQRQRELADPEKMRARRKEARARLTAEQIADKAAVHEAWREKNRERINEAAKVRSREWLRANSERAKAYRAEYLKTPRGKAARRHGAHLRRAREMEADHGCVNLESLQEIIEAAGGLCVYCGDQFEHLDHVHPLARGGLHCVENLAPACAHCNQTKHANVLPADQVPAPLMACPVRAEREVA